MKTIADFKRAMIKGTKWQATHKYIGDNPSPIKDMGARICGLNNTVSFAFINPESGELSYSDWPKKTEISFKGETVVITKPNFVELTYTKIQES